MTLFPPVIEPEHFRFPVDLPNYPVHVLMKKIWSKEAQNLPDTGTWKVFLTNIGSLLFSGPLPWTMRSRAREVLHCGLLREVVEDSGKPNGRNPET